MFQNEDAILGVMMVVLIILGAGIAVLMVLEVMMIARTVYAQFRDEWHYSHPVVGVPDRQVTPFRDRKTVERVIDRLEESNDQ
ncbi:MAG: hypothetical protein JXB07_13315 [Anaerolineae bacterium]|nr:hypothetical protein [Anaerolineae bacterium]